MDRKGLLLFLLVGLAARLPAQDLTIDSHEVPLVQGAYGKFKQNSSSFSWPAFDSTRTHWDLTSYPGGLWSRVSVVNWTTGAEPAPESMQADASDPQVMEIDTLGDGSVSDVYEYRDSVGLYVDGVDFDLIVLGDTYRVIGNFRPDARAYATPMHYGSAWSSSSEWQYEIVSGFPLSATEEHTKQVVGKGKVKVPISGEYYWPCLVIRDHYVVTPNLGEKDDRWIYEWVVPSVFSGGNSVAGVVSENGASQDFTEVWKMLTLSVCYVPGWDLRPPAFSHARVWPDTSYVGPFVVWSVIQDNDAVGEESLFYRVDTGAWVGTEPDSARADTFYFTIPTVTQSSRVDYYFWAKDSFSTANDVDLWTTWPVCSSESTMITFHVGLTGTAEQEPAVPGRIGLSASPNPLGDATTFYFNYPRVRQAAIKVFSSSGELVRTLDMSPVPSLGFQAHWDGRDEAGIELPAGTYLYRVESAGYTETRKVTLTR
jgi:hypothetical protein